VDPDGIYDVVVEANDGTTTEFLAVAVTVTDVAPVITAGSATPSVIENQTAVDTYANDEAGTWSLGGTDEGFFSIDGSSGVLTFKTAPDYETPASAAGTNTYLVDVIATDAANATTLNVTVGVTNIAPVITGPAARPAAENQTFVASYSNDEGGSWSLSGTDASFFSIDVSGNLTFVASPDFENPADADTDNIYHVVVEATDAAPSVGTLAVAVMVTDIDDFITGIEGGALNELNIYPIPVTNILNVETQNLPAGYYMLRIVNISGKTEVTKQIIVSIFNHHHVIEVNQLLQGVYTVILHQDDKVFIQKFVKQ
jgi:hypothetical protein